MAEKLMLLGVLILLVMAIGAIAEITDDIKAVRKTVSYLKEKESSIDSKLNYIRMMQTDLYGTLRDSLNYHASLEEQVDDKLRRSNKLMVALARITLATETTVEKLAKPKIHQKWNDRK